MASNKLKLLKIINPIIGILFLGQAISGIFHEMIPYEIFGKAHGTGGYLLVAGIIVHITLNWSWIQLNFLKPRKTK